MKISVIGLLMCTALAAGCGGNNKADMGQSDLAASQPDLSTTPSNDMAQADMAKADLAQASPDLAAATYTVNVGMGGNKFVPATLDIKVGDTVTWVWIAGNHNVVSGTGATADGKFCSPSDTNCATAALSTTGATYSHKFTAAGSYPYFCRPHAAGGMTGTITVN